MNTIIPQSVVLNEDRLEVLTPDGYKPFFGVNKIEKDVYYHLSFTNGKEIRCSTDHPFDTIDGIIKAKDLDETMEILTKDGGCFITKKDLIKEKIFLYDIVNSGPKHTYYTNGIVSHNCDFIGSAGTLIAGSKLKSLVYHDPITSSGGLDIFEDPIEDHEYLMTVDVSRGMKLDYSAFILVDITSYPHRLVAKYRNNTIKPMLFPDIIVNTCKKYNNAWILCEVNDIGDQVASIIYYDMEYENLLMTAMRGRAGQVLGYGFSGGKVQLGLKMAKAPKKLGCSNLKQMVESDKILFQDFQIINELTTFVEKRDSFSAEEGCHDDLVMCMVIYAWAVAQDYFKEMTEQSVREELYEKDKTQLEEDMAPFGFILDGSGAHDEVDTEGRLWKSADGFGGDYGMPYSPWEWSGQGGFDGW